MKEISKEDEEKKLERQTKLLLFYTGIVGCLLFACGVGTIFGWGWFLVTMGMSMLLVFVLGVIGYILEDE